MNRGKEAVALCATAEGQDGSCQHPMDFVDVSSWSTQTFIQLSLPRSVSVVGPEFIQVDIQLTVTQTQ